MNFKEMMKTDLEVFFNPDEFGEIHIINEKEAVIIIDNEKLDEIKAKSQYADGIDNAQMLLFIKASDFGPIPAISQPVVVDDDCYRVLKVSQTEGVYELILEANW